jgi:hypothetical protein
VQRVASDVFRRRTAGTNGRRRIPAATACMRAARDGKLAGRGRI